MMPLALVSVNSNNQCNVKAANVWSGNNRRFFCPSSKNKKQKLISKFNNNEIPSPLARR